MLLSDEDDEKETIETKEGYWLFQSSIWEPITLFRNI